MKILQYLFLLLTVALAFCGVASAAEPDPNVTALVTNMPGIDTSIIGASASKAFIAMAVFVAVGLGLRLFKRG